MLLCDVPGWQQAGRPFWEEYQQGTMIHLTLNFFSPENEFIETKVNCYRVIKAGNYWDAVVEPIEDLAEKRNDAIWQAVRDIANNSGGSEGP